MLRKYRLVWAIFLGLGLVLGLAACQSAPQAALSPTPPASPTAMPTTPPLPSPTPSPSPKPTPTASPTPAFPFFTPNAPPPSDAHLPSLHGALEDTAALQTALQQSQPEALDLWIAARPSAFPAHLPLPSQGQLALASHSRYWNQESWNLDLSLSQAPGTWLQTFENTLQRAGWKHANLPAGNQADLQPGIRHTAWCNPQQLWRVEIFTVPAGDDHTLAFLTYTHASSADELNCQHTTMPPAFPPPGLPTLTFPRGGSTNTSSGGSRGWIIHQQMRAPNGLKAALEDLTQQLVQQGWELQNALAGQMTDGQIAVARATKANASWPEAMLLLIGKAPTFDLWLWAGKISPQPLPLPSPGSLPALHGRTDDPLALQWALAMSAWRPYAASPQIWVGQPPTPWPLQTLPQPPQAQWESAQQEIYPDKSEGWTLQFVIPQSEEQAQSALKNLLGQFGWTLLPPNILLPPEAQVGFAPAPDAHPLLSNAFCHGQQASMIATYQPRTDNTTAVTWHLVSNAGLCAQTGAEMPSIPAPRLRLQLTAGEQPSDSGLEPRGVSFANGYTANAFWWSDRTPEAQIAAFGDQMAQQGWQISGQGQLNAQAAWLQAALTDANGAAWHTDVAVIALGHHYTYGVLIVARADR